MWLCFICLNVPSDLVCNAIVMFRPMLLFITWISWISYRNGYMGLSAQLLQPLLNLRLFVEMCLVETYFVSITLENVHLNCHKQFLFQICVRSLFVTLTAWICVPIPVYYEDSYIGPSFTLIQLNTDFLGQQIFFLPPKILAALSIELIGCVLVFFLLISLFRIFVIFCF